MVPAHCYIIPTVPLPSPVWLLQRCACNHPAIACLWCSASSCHGNEQLLFVLLPADEEVPPSLTREKDINIFWGFLIFFLLCNNLETITVTNNYRLFADFWCDWGIQRYSRWRKWGTEGSSVWNNGPAQYGWQWLRPVWAQRTLQRLCALLHSDLEGGRWPQCTTGSDVKLELAFLLISVRECFLILLGNPVRCLDWRGGSAGWSVGEYFLFHLKTES